ncbi:hypothetical protein V501_09158 [Pseudogymnoascus sp. VKM F-4519 (FW-2642)]|nr:hypothetical protein V501_09158 [Pseudogymnoascus sp. VKM F-4519 (FW-2642)]
MAVVFTTARAPSRPVAVVEHHASDPDKGKRARDCKRILLAYPEFLATLCVIDAAGDARVRETEEHLQAVALEGVDARQTARGAAARRGFQEGEQEAWDSDAEERGIREVAEDFVTLFLLGHPGKGVWTDDRREAA